MALRTALAAPDIAAFMQPLAGHVEPMTIPAFTKRMKDDTDLAKSLVTALNFKADS